MLLAQLNRAKAREERAAQLLALGHRRAANASLKHTLRWLISFDYRVSSLTGRRQIGKGTRGALIAAAQAIEVDVRTLLHSSSVSGALVLSRR
jgi:hypothetical protein